MSCSWRPRSARPSFSAGIVEVAPQSCSARPARVSIDVAADGALEPLEPQVDRFCRRHGRGF